MKQSDLRDAVRREDRRLAAHQVSFRRRLTEALQRVDDEMRRQGGDKTHGKKLL